VIPARVLKSVQNLNRIPEILECRRQTPQWLTLTAAYVGINSRLPFEIDLPSGSFDFHEASDVATFWQIFYRHDYPVRRSDHLIVDAGANIGAFTLFALRTAPKANVIAIEPAPDSCSRLRKMLRTHALQSRCTLHEAALAPAPGETTINLEAASQFRRTGLSGKPVKAITFDQVMPDSATVDLLKMDIEGAEYAVLPAISRDALSRVRRIVLEYHPNASYVLAVEPLKAQNFSITYHRDDGEGYGVVWLEQLQA
jgi:FkbM family methyltransferase